MASYKYLRVSDGSGDAPLMTITNDRAAGSTLLKVSTVVGCPAFFVATSGTLGPDGFITAASKREFRAHIDGANIIIDGFEPGSTDTGNTASQVVVIRPNTNWADRVASFIMNATGFGSGEDVTFQNIVGRSLQISNNLVVNGSASVQGDLTVNGQIIRPAGIGIVGYRQTDDLIISSNTWSTIPVTNTRYSKGVTLNSDKSLAFVSEAGLYAISMSLYVVDRAGTPDGMYLQAYAVDANGNNMHDGQGPFAYARLDGANNARLNISGHVYLEVGQAVRFSAYPNNGNVRIGGLNQSPANSPEPSKATGWTMVKV